MAAGTEKHVNAGMTTDVRGDNCRSARNTSVIAARPLETPQARDTPCASAKSSSNARSV